MEKRLESNLTLYSNYMYGGRFRTCVHEGSVGLDFRLAVVGYEIPVEDPPTVLLGTAESFGYLYDPAFAQSRNARRLVDRDGPGGFLRISV